jgi:hypothetical protein
MRLKTAAISVLIATLVAGCGGGGRPEFQRATGWELLSGHGELAAANVPFAASDRSLQSPPSRTVSSLPRNGIVIWAMYLRGGNSHFPRKELPLRVEQAVTSNPFEGFGCAPAVTLSSCYAASGSIWRLLARHGSYDVDLYVFFGTDRPLPEAIAAADAELARLMLPHSIMPPKATKVPNCPRPSGTGYYDSTAHPASGPAGTTVTVSGRLPVLTENGTDTGQTSTEVAAYWNLDFDHWPSITNTSPVAAVAGSPVTFLGTQNVSKVCGYRVRVTIPTVAPGRYPIEVLFGDVNGGASFAPVEFRVTRS